MFFSEQLVYSVMEKTKYYLINVVNRTIETIEVLHDGNWTV